MRWALLNALALVALVAPGAAAGAAGPFAHTLMPGATGADVHILQSWLTAVGIPTATDGDFGPGTRASVARFQTAAHLGPVTGTAGMATAVTLEAWVRARDSLAAGGHPAPTPFTRTLRSGDRGSDVRTLQGWLAAVGIPTSADGIYGSGTAASVSRFQGGDRLTPVTGTAGVVTTSTLQAWVRAGEKLAAGAADGPPAPPPITIPPSDFAHWVFPLTPATLVLPPSTWTPDQGVDISTVGGACGARVLELAVASGTIVLEGVAGFGPATPVLELDSGPLAGRYVYYGHAQDALVPVGTHVSAGEPIAEVGCGIVGISSGPHLELGISAPGGPPCCPGIGQTAGSLETALRALYAHAG